MVVPRVALPRRAVNTQKLQFHDMVWCVEQSWESAELCDVGRVVVLGLTLCLDKLWFYVRILRDMKVKITKGL